MRPVLIVVSFVAAQDPPQMGLVPDEGAVQAFASASAGPAFDDRVPAVVRMLQGTIRIPASARTAPDAAVKPVRGRGS
jgi:hypothetical protein